MSKSLTLHIKDEIYEVFRKAAQTENRSVPNFIETAALARICEQQFTDDVELDEILSDQNLMERMKRVLPKPS
ncbi:hypothetical protein QUF72_02480 [Desulfobacterales bacterium HSG2]|nr:hypothetical protein [Desulfobacterales bacterium HSG2]